MIGFAGEVPLPDKLDPGRISSEIEESPQDMHTATLFAYVKEVSRILAILPPSSRFEYMHPDWTLYVQSGLTMITIRIIDNEDPDNHTAAASFYLAKDWKGGQELNGSITEFISRTILNWREE